MNLSRLTGSKAPLVLPDPNGPDTDTTCTYWLRTDVAWTDGDSTYADGGRAVHRMLAAVVNDGVIEVPERTELRALYASGRAWLDGRKRDGFRAEVAFTLDGRKRVGFRAEVAFAYDVATDTARELEDPPGEDLRWYARPELRAKYGVRDTEICMRTDLVSIGADEDGWYAWVADFKCHFGPEYVDARAQLALCALAVSRAYGREGQPIERVKAVGVHLWVDREAVEEPYELRAYELGLVATRLADLAEAPPKGPNEGPWCRARYCPARAACPVTTKAAGELEDLILPERLVRRNRSLLKPIATNEDGAWSLVAIDLVASLLEAKKAEAKAFADAHHGILTADGEIYAGEPEPVERPNLDAPRAIEVLEGMGLAPAIERSTTWAAITEVGGEPKAKEAREALRAVGAVKTSTRVVYKARPQKPSAKALAKGPRAEPANRRTA